jgi:hypothetical protein
MTPPSIDDEARPSQDRHRRCEPASRAHHRLPNHNAPSKRPRRAPNRREAVLSRGDDPARSSHKLTYCHARTSRVGRARSASQRASVLHSRGGATHARFPSPIGRRRAPSRQPAMAGVRRCSRKGRDARGRRCDCGWRRSCRAPDPTVASTLTAERPVSDRRRACVRALWERLALCLSRCMKSRSSPEGSRDELSDGVLSDFTRGRS